MLYFFSAAFENSAFVLLSARTKGQHMQRNRPIKRNLALATGFTLVNLWQFIVLPLFFLPQSPLWLITLIPLAFVSNSLWFLMHEAVHNNLVSGREWNLFFGRVLAVGFGAPFEVLRFGHLMHHRFNGETFDRPDLYDPAKVSRARAAVSYYVNIMGGLYAEELLSFFIFFLPRPAIEKLVDRYFKSSEKQAERKLGEQAERMLVTVEAVRSIRIQGIVFLGILALSMFLYGAFWFVPLLILALRAFFISFANNLPHYATTDRDRKFGLNLSMPRWAHLFYLNFYHHRTHHHAPVVPWPDLPDEFKKKRMAFDRPLLNAALAQFRGPLPVSAAGSQGEGTSSTS